MGLHLTPTPHTYTFIHSNPLQSQFQQYPDFHAQQNNPPPTLNIYTLTLRTTISKSTENQKYRKSIVQKIKSTENQKYRKSKVQKIKSAENQKYGKLKVQQI